MSNFLSGHKCDIWKPTENITSEGQVKTSRYFKHVANIDCRFNEAPARSRMISGLDLTMEIRILYVKGELVPSSYPLHQFDIVVDKGDGSKWLVNNPVEHWTLPKNRYRAPLTLLKSPPSEVI